MTARDLVQLSGGAVRSHRIRSGLTMLGIVIGISSVILLTSIGEGVRRYVLREFTQFGTNLLGVHPGKTRTGGVPGALTATVRKLTIADALALQRVRGVERVMPLAVGAGRVEGGGRGRSVYVYGATSDLPEVWRFGVRQGRFLPPGDPRRGAAVVVLGPRLKRELFGEANALGEHVRIGGTRFLVIGVMAPKGQFLGIDLDDSAYVPVSRALTLFNRDELHEIDVLFSSESVTESVVAGIRKTMMDRHDGEEDFSIITQSGMLDVLDRVLRMVSIAVSGIAAISLLVGAIGILTMMWISVNERTSEIGLLKALGATPRQILALYLAEAGVLSLLGGAIGVGLGLGIARALHWALPGLPVHTPMPFVLAALGVSLAVGLLSGVLPARRAAALDPLEALRAE